MADTLGLLDVNCDIYSMDLDPSNRSEIVNKLKPPNVSFLQGNSFEIEKTFTDEFLKNLPHPWVFSEDGHANLPGVLRYFHQYLQEGDYMVVEDTCPDLAKEFGMYMGTVNPPGGFRKMGRKQLDCLRDFLQEYEDFYAVDSFLTDLFGYNCRHWHGFIRKMK